MTGSKFKTNSKENPSPGPLASIRVLDISTIIAGPLAACLMADFGAEVLKVEMPIKGDALRALRPQKDGVSLWSKVVNRNKRGITIDLRFPEGAELVKKLVVDCDVLVENFRPGTLVNWGLGPDVLQEINPKLTILRVSAFGQTGPYANKPGFARVADAMSGFLSLCGELNGPPMHAGYPVADSITGLFGALGIVTALLERERNNGSSGQVIDVSLFESMFRILDFLPIEYDQLGEVRQRSGNLNPYAAPSNCYQANDGQWITLTATTQVFFERACKAIGRKELIEDARFTTNIDRLRNVAQLDAIFGAWFADRTSNEACAVLEKYQVTASPMKTINELFEDPQVEENNMIVKVEDQELGQIRMQGITPKLSRTPGWVHKAGPKLGDNNHEIFMNFLGLGAQEISNLKKKKVI